MADIVLLTLNAKYIHGRPFASFLRWTDWLYAASGRKHGIALGELAEFLFSYLTRELGLEPLDSRSSALARLSARRTIRPASLLAALHRAQRFAPEATIACHRSDSASQTFGMGPQLCQQPAGEAC